MCLWVTLPNFDLKRIVKRLRLFIFAVRYNETMTASKHLIGRDDLIISLATSYNLAIDRLFLFEKIEFLYDCIVNDSITSV